MPKIITAHTGAPHISAGDVGALLKAVTGNNDYLLSDTPEEFTATLLENNNVQLSNAEVVLQGTHIRIQNTDVVTIPQGQRGMKRIDLIVCRYTKSQEGIEGAEIAVVKGAPSISPNIPVVTQGDIRNGATLHEMPLFKVEIEDFAITAITNVCDTINTLDSVLKSLNELKATSSLHAASIEKLNNAKDSIGSTVETHSNQIEKINTNRLLWSGALYMNENQTITIPSIQSQSNGIILIFSVFADGVARNYNFYSFTIPKYLVNKHSDCGHEFTMIRGLYSSFCYKYLYISNTVIRGHADNVALGVSSDGIKYNNRDFVLRYVIGF